MCYRARTEPLGLVYRDDSIEFGAMVVDVSDIGRVRYGIVAFSVRRLLHLPEGTPWRFRSHQYYGREVPTVEATGRDSHSQLLSIWPNLTTEVMSTSKC
jgi:hypothetical protein